MRILHTTPLYYPVVGGNEIQNRELSEKIASMGEEVAVFTSNASIPEQFYSQGSKDDYLLPEEVVNGVKVKRFKIDHGLKNFTLNRLDKIRGGTRITQMLFKDSLPIWHQGPFIPRMLLAIRKYNPQVMLAINNMVVTTYLCYLAKKIFKIPLFVRPTTHVADQWTENPIVMKMLSYADAVVATTEFEKQYLIQQGLDEERIVINGNGVDPDKFHEASGQEIKNKHQINGEPVVTFVGRQDKRKGIVTLIDAMRIVWKNIGNAKLIIAGKKVGHTQDEVQKQIDSMSESERKNILFENVFSEETKGEIYAASDIFAMPSNIDSFGTVYLEAWASSKPVIACLNTPQETIIENNHDGILVEFGNAVQLSEAIIGLLKNKELRCDMGKNGNKKIHQKYAWDIIGDKYRKLYAQFCEKNK